MTGIKIESLYKSFNNGRKETRVLSGIDLEIEPGEFFFLLGPSGCGKTTLLRIIAGLIEPSGGRIFFGQRDVTELDAGKRRSAMVFQNYALWPHMTVMKNTQFGLESRGAARDEREKAAAESLKLVEMDHLGERKPTQLSGGQQQRVALARAITSNPDCLLLDEPLSNLDAKLRLQMRQQLVGLVKRSGCTAIYVTHDQKEALSMADRIAVMNNGVIEQIGTPREVYERPRTAFVASFIGECNFIEARGCGGQTLESSIGAIETCDKNDSGEFLCCLRPENVLICPQEPQGPNVFEATIEQSVYLGELTQFEVSLGANVKWKSLMISGGGCCPEEGSKVWVQIPPRSVIAIKR
jgi:ABC-type Fe3+/spermidine/putrescine transport system ATPase subunit